LRQWGEAYLGYQRDGQLHPDAVPADLTEQSLIVASQELDAPFFEALDAQLQKSDDGTVRDYLITAMASADDPALAAKARDMMTSLDLRTNERMAIAYQQMYSPESADALFQWFKGKYTMLRPLFPEGVQKRMPMLASRYCSPEKAQEVRDYFQPLMAELPGGERSLNNTLETIALCHAFVAAQPAIQWEPLSVSRN
jgi:alanyl aminopeptidase